MKTHNSKQRFRGHKIIIASFDEITIIQYICKRHKSTSVFTCWRRQIFDTCNCQFCDYCDALNTMYLNKWWFCGKVHVTWTFTIFKFGCAILDCDTSRVHTHVLLRKLFCDSKSIHSILHFQSVLYGRT